MKVLDASGILRSDLDFTDDIYCIPNSVMLEIHDNVIKSLIDLAIRRGNIKIIDPDKKSLERVLKAAEKTGDITVLSDSDIDILALALEKKLNIVSDDYAIQNTALQLGLKYEASVHDSIKRRITWQSICSGCGKVYDIRFKGLCKICGSKILRKERRS